MSDRCKYYSRDNQRITSWNFADNLLTLFPEQEWAKVRDVDNVIDIMLIGYDRVARSCSPKLFKKHANEQSHGCTGMDKNSYIWSYSDKQNPFQICALAEEAFTALPSVATGTERGSQELGNVDSSTIAAMRYDDVYYGKYYTYSTSEKVTSLAKMYHGMEMIDWAMRRGYQLFDPDNLLSWKNWNAYHPSDYHQYVLVMYLDSRSAALHMGCFDPDRTPSTSAVIKALFDSNSLSDKSLMKKMTHEACSDPFPSYSRLPQGKYYMGTTVFSSNTRYKLILQPDGNWVIYRLGTGKDITEMYPSWDSKTALYEYAAAKASKSGTRLNLQRPELRIQPDGNVVLYSRDGVVIWSTNTTKAGTDIAVILSGDVIHVFNANDPNKIIWSSKTPWGSWVNNLNVYTYLISTNVCSLQDANNRASDTKLLLSEKADYCTFEDNMINDPECMKLFRDQTLTQDYDDQRIKNRVADYVKLKYCTNETAVNKASDKIKDMCSCTFPTDATTKTFKDAGGPLYCTDKCLTKGFRDQRDAPKNINCTTCINKIDINNTYTASEVKASCYMSTSSSGGDTTNISSGSSTTITNNSTNTAGTETSQTSGSNAPPSSSSVTNEQTDAAKKQQEMIIYIILGVLGFLAVAFLIKRHRNTSATMQYPNMNMMNPYSMFARYR